MLVNKIISCLYLMEDFLFEHSKMQLQGEFDVLFFFNITIANCFIV